MSGEAQLEKQSGWQQLLGPITPEERGRCRGAVHVDWHESSLAIGRPVEPSEFVLHVDETDSVRGIAMQPEGTPRGIAIAMHQTTDPPTHGVSEPFGISGDPELRYGRELAERGYVALGVNYPGFGGYECDVYSLGYASVSAKGIWNHACLLRAAQARWPELPVVVIGHSLGGTNALLFSWWDVRPMVTVCSAALTMFPEFALRHGNTLSRWSRREKYMPRIADMYGNDPHRLPTDFDDILRSICPRPLFATIATQDDIFPVGGARRAADAAKRAYGNSTKCVIREYDAPHSFPAQARFEAYRFIDDQMTMLSPRTPSH